MSPSSLRVMSPQGNANNSQNNIDLWRLQALGPNQDFIFSCCLRLFPYIQCADMIDSANAEVKYSNGKRK